MAKGNDARRKIRANLNVREGKQAEAETVSDLRKEIGQGLSGKDFEMNLRAMHGNGELARCSLRPPKVCVALRQ